MEAREGEYTTWIKAPVAEELCDPDLLKKIQAGGKSVWLRDWTAEEILADKEPDPALTAFVLHLNSESEAEDFMEKLEKKYR